MLASSMYVLHTALVAPKKGEEIYDKKDKVGCDSCVAEALAYYKWVTHG